MCSNLVVYKRGVIEFPRGASCSVFAQENRPQPLDLPALSFPLLQQTNHCPPLRSVLDTRIIDFFPQEHEGKWESAHAKNWHCLILHVQKIRFWFCELVFLTRFKSSVDPCWGHEENFFPKLSPADTFVFSFFVGTQFSMLSLFGSDPLFSAKVGPLSGWQSTHQKVTLLKSFPIFIIRTWPTSQVPHRVLLYTILEGARPEESQPIA